MQTKHAFLHELAILQINKKLPFQEFLGGWSFLAKIFLKIHEYDQSLSLHTQIRVSNIGTHIQKPINYYYGLLVDSG